MHVDELKQRLDRILAEEEDLKVAWNTVLDLSARLLVDVACLPMLDAYREIRRDIR